MKRKTKRILKNIFLGLLIIGIAGAALNLFKDDKKVEKEDDGVLELVISKQVGSEEYDGSKAITIQYEEGMTWREWIESDYNNGDYDFTLYDGETHVMIGSVPLFAKGIGSPVTPDSVIDSNLFYHY